MVLQGGGTYSGTFQSSSTDSYHGTSTTNSSDSQQLSSNYLSQLGQYQQQLAELR